MKWNMKKIFDLRKIRTEEQKKGIKVNKNRYGNQTAR